MSLSLLLITNFIFIGHASEFLKATPQAMVERLSEESIRTTLLEEIEGSLGTSMSRKRTDEIERQLRPIFTALPKNENGKLDHVTVRYALHRLFVMRHGWNIKGLDPNGESWNSSSPAGVLKDQAPAYIHSMFEERLGVKGLGLHELAVMGSTIEHLIHNEAIGRLAAVFNVHKLLPTETVSTEQATELLDTYMMAYVLGQNLTGLSADDARELVKEMPDIAPFWSETQKFVNGIRSNIIEALPSKDMDFTTLAKIVEVVGEQFGRFQSTECTQMKNSLVQIEDRGTGRVKLADFYKPALDGAFHFSESVSYLRNLGALDETDAKHPGVVIPNYLLSETNCIASSGFYSVCCIDEGEDLLSHVEEKIGAPEATPAIIAALVANLPSSSVQAPRVLPATLLKRLDDIAAGHEGTVPLHSRLFGQWMHHALPREFPLPHMSGTTSQVSPEEWLSSSGSHYKATAGEMSQFSHESATKLDTSEAGELLPWSHEQELLVPRSPSRGSSSPLRKVFYLLVLVAVAFGMAQMLKGANSPQLGKLGKKYMDNGKYIV
jgi:hypothetical protein